MKILIIVLTLIIAGCELTAKEIEEAKEVCEGNLGLLTVAADGIVKCRNGARFYL